MKICLIILFILLLFGGISPLVMAQKGELVTKKSNVAAPKSEESKEKKPPLYVRIFYRKRLLDEKFKKMDWSEVEMLTARIAYLKNRIKGFKRAHNREQAKIFKKSLKSTYKSRRAIVSKYKLWQYNRMKKQQQKKSDRRAGKRRK